MVVAEGGVAAAVAKEAAAERAKAAAVAVAVARAVKGRLCLQAASERATAVAEASPRCTSAWAWKSLEAVRGQRLNREWTPHPRVDASC